MDELGLPELPDEDRDSLELLSGELGEGAQQPQVQSQEEQIVPPKKRDILTFLNEEFTEKHQLQPQMRFGELILTTLLTREVEAQIRIRHYGSGDRRLIVSSHLPFSSVAMKQILELCARPEFVGRLCIEKQKGTPHFIIKKELELFRYSDSDIKAIANEIFRQSQEVAEILESHSYGQQ